MNVDRSNYKLLCSGECCDLCVVDNKIYFSAHNINFNGNNEEILLNSILLFTNYYSDKLYTLLIYKVCFAFALNGSNFCVLTVRLYTPNGMRIAKIYDACEKVCISTLDNDIFEKIFFRL